MLSDGVSEHQILKIFLGGGHAPRPLDGLLMQLLPPLAALVPPPHSKTTSFTYVYAPRFATLVLVQSVGGGLICRI